jgi:hypothetical protein
MWLARRRLQTERLKLPANAGRGTVHAQHRSITPGRDACAISTFVTRRRIFPPDDAVIAIDQRSVRAAMYGMP